MTEQITVPKQTWDALREALETCTYTSSYSKSFDIVKVEEALTAANAVQPQAQGEVDALREALVYVAHAGHSTKQHMLPTGVMLLDNDGVVVRVPDGPQVWGGRVPDYEKQRLAAHPQATEPAWIAASDRLPEEDKRVLVWYRGHVSTTSLWRGGFITDSAEQPTHWMPLPAAPEAHQ